jgi:hypothetical protein
LEKIILARINGVCVTIQQMVFNDLMIKSLSDYSKYGIAQPVNSSASVAFLCEENVIQLLPSEGGVEMV